ncbi:MAG TPA: DUF5693 family protein, partial [bacterium]|nr:DUF5693 family protein [bacterium]
MPGFKLETGNIIALALALAFLSNVYTAARRWGLERENRNCELVLEYGDLFGFARETGRSAAEVFEELKEAGITTLILPMENLVSLEEEGRAIVVDSREVERIIFMGGKFDFLKEMEIPNRPEMSYVFTQEAGLGEWIRDVLKKKLGDNQVIGLYRGKYYLVIVSQSKDALKKMFLGFWPGRIEETAALGSRFLFSFGFDEFSSKAWLDSLPGLSWKENYSGVLFQNEEWPDSPEFREFLSKFVSRPEVRVARLEFETVPGLDRLLRPFGEKVIGCHRTPVKKTSPEVLTERFLRSARERNMRLLVLDPAGKSFSEYLGWTAVLRDRLRASGFVPGPARPFSPWKEQWIFLFLSSLGVWTALLWLVRIVGGFPVYVENGLLLAGLGFS